MKKTKEEILAMSLSDLNIKTNPRNVIILKLLKPLIDMNNETSQLLIACEEGFNSIKKGFDSQWRNLLNKEASIIKISDVITVWDSQKSKICKSTEKFLFDKLISLGLTHWDWIKLPRKTLSRQFLSTLTKEDWLNASIGMIDTIRMNYVDGYQKRFIEVFNSEIKTVKDLVNFYPDELINANRMYDYMFYPFTPISVVRTRIKLRSLGFTKEDGLFLSDDIDPKILRIETKLDPQKNVTHLMREYALSQKNAELVDRIARAEKWI